MSSEPGKRTTREPMSTNPCEPWSAKRARYARDPPPPRQWDILSDTTSDHSADEITKYGVTTGKHDPTAWSQLPQPMKTTEIPYPYQPPVTRREQQPTRECESPAKENVLAGPGGQSSDEEQAPPCAEAPASHPDQQEPTKGDPISDLQVTPPQQPLEP